MLSDPSVCNDAAYLAGLIDGEGSIYIGKGSFTLKIDIKDKECIEYFKEPKWQESKKLWRVAWHNELAVNVLRCCYPYMKHPQKRARAFMAISKPSTETWVEFSLRFREKFYAIPF